MHRDFKAEVAASPSPNLAAQQRRLERWRHEYNHQRPHEALGQRPPAEFYQRSNRRLNENDKPLVYPKHLEVKEVSSTGFLAHEGHTYHLGDAFAGKRVGLDHRPGGRVELYFANVHLGTLTLNSDDPWRPAAFVAPAARASRAPAATQT